jgi:hypothetical protein
MVFNATFNNISVISWQSVLLVEETGGPGERNMIDISYYFIKSYINEDKNTDGSFQCRELS